MCHLGTAETVIVIRRRICAFMAICEGCFLAFYPVRTEGHPEREKVGRME